MDDYVLGIDLGATKIASGLIDPQNRIIASGRIPTNVADGPANAVERIAQSVVELAGELPAGQKIAAIGICSPGPLDHETGLLLDPPNLTGWRNVPLRQMLAERLNLPVVLEHDAKATAWGEYYYGAGRGERSMVYIVVGTGVGAAFILDGRLYRGMRNCAGEVGGITIDRLAERYGNLCGSGIRGCAQGYTCGPALAYHYQRFCKEAGQNCDASVTGEQVAQLTAQGDGVARRVMDQAGEALGVLVATLAMTLDIELYVIGGSVVKAGDLFLEPARQTMPFYTFQSIGSRVRLAPAALGDDGPILGCGWLARQLTTNDQ